jgi:hypothetical protein
MCPYRDPDLCRNVFSVILILVRGFMPENQGMEATAAKFMLQEHSRIIDAYHDLHVQKNELIRVYLTFVSLPATVVAIFLSVYKYLEPTVPLGGAGGILQTAGVYLSLLLVLIGVSVLQVMLGIRIEQLLYVKTINAARQYFKDTCGIEEKYLVLPSDRDQIMFGHEEIWGRAYWESMIVGFTNSMLLAFLFFEGAHHLGLQTACSVIVGVGIGVIGIPCHAFFIQHRLRRALEELKVTDTLIY